MEYLKSPLIEEMTIALRCVGGILQADNTEIIDSLLFLGVLDALDNLINPDQSVHVMKEALWCISNITAGTENQIRTFISYL
jgi:hypothetical protein